MTNHTDAYLVNLYRKLDIIVPGITGSIERIDSLPNDTAQRIVRQLLTAACRATNGPTIEGASCLLERIPPAVINANLVTGAKHGLNLDDEWEFRRLLELLKRIGPQFMAQFIKDGLSSSDAGVREAAQDFGSGRYGPVQGLNNDA